MSMLDFIEYVDDQMLGMLSNLPSVDATQLGLDDRAGLRFYVNEEEKLLIVDTNCDRALQYYGGFKYVNEEARTVLGEWIIYNGEMDNRVAKCIEMYCNNG